MEASNEPLKCAQLVNVKYKHKKRDGWYKNTFKALCVESKIAQNKVSQTTQKF